MSYIVSQLTKNSYKKDGFAKPVTVAPCTVANESPFFDKSRQTATIGPDSFTDLAFECTGDSNNWFMINETYYFRCRIRKVSPTDYVDIPNIPSSGEQQQLKVSLMLRASDGTEIETLDTFIVPKAVTADPEYYNYSIVFTPVQTAKYLVLKLNRIGYDVLARDPRSWLIDGLANYNRVDHVDYSGQNGEFSKLTNILKINSGITSWTRMGFQSRPGVQIVVNQSPVRVGRSGIYELNIGMNINSVMIAAPKCTNSDYIDDFLLDYAYVTS